jgi:hypothetical protein
LVFAFRDWDEKRTSVRTANLSIHNFAISSNSANHLAAMFSFKAMKILINVITVMIYW